jgi:hypothetical protein
MSTTTEPVLLKQYKLLGAVIDARWATGLDHKITRHVIDRYFAKFGNARASLRYLEAATGAKRNKIIPSLRRIIDKGVISVIRQGIGTRPTEYDLNFDFAAKIPSGAPEGTSTSCTLEGTSSGSLEGTSTASSGTPQGTESYLPNMSTDMLTVSRIDGTPAVPAAPPVSGLEADPAASAVDPGSFEELWNAFPRKHQRAKARMAYNALTPDRELHDRLVKSAMALAKHHEVIGTDKKWWKHLHTWLAQECYLEDLPQPYENRKDAAIARARERGPKKATAHSTDIDGDAPVGRHEVTIIGFKALDEAGGREQRFSFSYRIRGGKHDGREFSHMFVHWAYDNDDVSTKGKRLLADITRAVGKPGEKEAEQLYDIPLCAIVSGAGTIRYEAL